MTIHSHEGIGIVLPRGNTEKVSVSNLESSGTCSMRARSKMRFCDEGLRIGQQEHRDTAMRSAFRDAQGFEYAGAFSAAST